MKKIETDLLVVEKDESYLLEPSIYRRLATDQ
jgi:hypothetical protein